MTWKVPGEGLEAKRKEEGKQAGLWRGKRGEKVRKAKMSDAPTYTLSALAESTRLFKRELLYSFLTPSWGSLV